MIDSDSSAAVDIVDEIDGKVYALNICFISKLSVLWLSPVVLIDESFTLITAIKNRVDFAKV